MNSNIKKIEQKLSLLADKRQADIYQRYFKTEIGGYGEGDIFLGITNPKVRKVVKEVWEQTGIHDAQTLACSMWHEVRLCGLLILVARFEQAYKSGDKVTMDKIFNCYVSLYPYINNWDLVDLTVYKIVGRYELLNQYYTLMDEWISPDHTLWQRRMAMVATWMHARHGFYDKLVFRAEALTTASHDLLHKATGWMLREMYKHDERGRETLENFLNANIHNMPSVMLSYAIEKMSKLNRSYWRTKRNNIQNLNDRFK